MTTAVVTGLGVVAPTGVGLESYWAATMRGDNGIGEITHFDAGQYPSRLAGEVREFDLRYRLNPRLVPQTDPMTRMALLASDWALEDAQLDPAEIDDFGMGVVTASASGGFDFGHRELEKLWSKGGQHVSAYQSYAWFYAVNTGQISIRHGMRGPTGVLVTEQAGGLDVLGQARRAVREGTSIVLTGGVDSSLCSWGWVAQLPNGRISTSEDPETAYLPFTDAAAGYVPGEGGAIMVVQDADSVRPGQRVYGELAGYAATFDPHPDTGREPTLRRALELALDDAGVLPREVDVVFADAAGVAELDAVEAAAIEAVFGPRGVPTTAPKTTVGRLYSGGAALDVVAALLCLRDGVIPPTTNVERAAGRYHLDLVTAPRRTPVRTAVVLARGYGGFNAAVVLRSGGQA